jgi:hypothetical protein
MFGLTQLQERLISLGIMAVMAISGFFYIEHLGAQKCEKAVEKANVAEVKKETTQRATDIGTTQKEGQTFETAKTEPIAPAPVITLGVCPTVPRKAGPTAPTAGPGANGEAPVRTANSELPTVQWDTEPIVRIGHEANAQVTGLQDYITNVCRPK